MFPSYLEGLSFHLDPSQTDISNFKYLPAMNTTTTKTVNIISSRVLSALGNFFFVHILSSSVRVKAIIMLQK